MTHIEGHGEATSNEVVPTRTSDIGFAIERV